MAEKVFLIDGNSLINRAYYALPPLTTVHGEPTNAVYGFTMMLYRLIDDYKPDRIYVAFDVSAPTFRHKKYVEYKANRKGMPDDLRPQMDTMKEVLDAWGIQRLELAGYEADDIIGTVAKRGEEAGYDVYIVTGDRDALQLISDQTTVMLTKRGIKDLELVDPVALKENYELDPDQVIDFKGLMGDSSDNIPGVPGVGEKTALKLLHSHHSMKQLYDEIDQQKGKLKERLIENKDLALLSRELATIDCEVPVTVDFTVEKEPDVEALVKTFVRLEFKSLVERLSETVDVADYVQAELPVAKSLDMVDIRQDNLDELQVCLDEQPPAGFFLSESGLTIATKEQVWLVAPELYPEFIQLINDFKEPLRIYCDDAKAFYKQFPAMDRLEIVCDIELAGYVLDPGSTLDLSSLSVKYSQLPPLVIDEERPKQAAAVQAQRVGELAPILLEQLTQDGLSALYYQVELPLARILSAMELRGIEANVDKLDQLSKTMGATLEHLTTEIYKIAGEEFNINSPKQLGVILFEKLGLPVIKKTKTGPSTDAEVLEQLSYHPVVDNLLEYRTLNKLKSTYTDALAHLINPETKRIHTTFNQTVTATGRLSSANPNLQNIPVRTVEGRRIRGAFEAKSDWYLLSADYSQIELRVLAHISQDERLIETFNAHIDIHTRTASEVMQIPLERVTPEERSSAKAVNFGIIYGISSFGLAKGTNLTRAKAQEYIDMYFERYPKVKEYMDKIVDTAKAQGYVTTILNRRRYLPDITSRNYMRRSFAERMAMNSPIQGSAADIIKLAMIKVEEQLKAQNLQARLLLQVHDELVLEVPQDELEITGKLVKEAMESVLELAVKLEVDVKTGHDWEHLLPISEVK